MKKKYLPGLLTIILVLVFSSCAPKDSNKISNQDNNKAGETIIEDKIINDSISNVFEAFDEDSVEGHIKSDDNAGSVNIDNTNVSNTGAGAANKNVLGPEHSFTISNEQIVIRKFDKDTNKYSYINYTESGEITNQLGYPGTITNGKFSVTVGAPDDADFAQSFFVTREWKESMESEYSNYQYKDVYFSDLSARYFDLVMLIYNFPEYEQISRESYSLSVSGAIYTHTKIETRYIYVDKPQILH